MDIILNSRKGGKTTRRIMEELSSGPKNANVISKNLDINYKTVKYHLDESVAKNFFKRRQVKGITYYYLPETLNKNNKK